MKSLRWKNGHSRWSPSRETIQTGKYGVERIGDRDAKSFVAQHHYSGSMPPVRRAYGLFRSSGFGLRLVGVCAFTVPMQPASITKWCQVPSQAGVELGRLVLLDEEPYNAETFFVSKSLKRMHRDLPEIRAVLSYSDPVPRIRADGTTVLRGHVGVVYQALNMAHVGRSSARTLVITPDAQVVSERSLSKLRNSESGAEGAYRMLLAHGAPAMKPGEAPGEYVRRALVEGPFRRIRHPGNIAYVAAVGDKRLRKATAAGFPPSVVYPRKSVDYRPVA